MKTAVLRYFRKYFKTVARNLALAGHVWATWVIATHFSLVMSMSLIFVTSTSWLFIFLFGLPKWMTADMRNVLPPDTRQRLND